MHLSYLRLLLLITTLVVLLAGCGGGTQPSNTPTSETKVLATASQIPSADPELNLRFRDAVEKFVETSWSTWALGEQIGQCFITNAGLMTEESKEAVIKHGIDEAFDELSGVHLGSIGKVWDLCESEAASPSASSSAKTPSATTTTTSIDPTSAPVQTLDFESATGHQNFSDVLQAQFQGAVEEHFDTATEKAGISVAVYQGGYLWRYAKGKASSSAEMTVGTPILIRSTSKTFLAGLVLQQIDEGLYSLSDTLSSVLSEHKGYEALDKNVINPDVTVEQLLTMTSGIQDVTDYYQPEFTALQESQSWEPVAVVRLVTTDFIQPGTYQYVNTNSMLLGLIAEHAGKQQLNELYKSVFFDPIGIVAVLLPQDTPPSNTARPHGDRSQWGGTGFGDIMESSHHGDDWYRATGKTTWAAAGMITTPENMARWAYELLSEQGSALPPTARARLLDSFTGPLISIGGSEPEHRYGHHLTRTTLSLSSSSITAYGHPGSGGGYTSDFFYSPELDLSISLLINSHSAARSRAEAQGKIGHRNLGDIAQQIFEAYVSQ
jgi:CubicO group peptidase (beta-lactamase class C family)